MSDDADLVLDVIAPCNREVWFLPLQMTLRSDKRVTEAKGGRSVPAALIQVGGTIPGQQLRVNTKTKVVTLIDKMSLKENAHIDKVLRRLTMTDDYRQSAFGDYAEEKTWTIAEGEWPTFLYWTRRHIDHGRFVMVKGTDKHVPLIDDILKMGEIRLGTASNAPPKNPDMPYFMANEHHFAGTPRATPVTSRGQ